MLARIHMYNNPGYKDLQNPRLPSSRLRIRAEEEVKCSELIEDNSDASTEDEDPSEPEYEPGTTIELEELKNCIQFLIWNALPSVRG